MGMPIAWTEFNECIKDRIAYYQQQYDQASRICRRLLKDDNSSEEQIQHVVGIQQAMADELSRLHGLRQQYASAPKVRVFHHLNIQIQPVRLN
jgi:hypothetical protein